MNEFLKNAARVTWEGEKKVTAFKLRGREKEGGRGGKKKKLFERRRIVEMRRTNMNEKSEKSECGERASD